MRLLISVALLLVGWSVSAQEVWLRPDKYFYNPGENARVDLLSGYEFIGKPSTFQKKDIEQINMYFGQEQTDLRASFIEGDKPFFLAKLAGEGVYSFILQTDSILKIIPDSSFNSFVKEFEIEGMKIASGSTNVRTQTTIKCYVRVGKHVDVREERSLNFPIEVIPDKNPLTLKKGEKIVFKVLRNGQPAFGVRVRISNRWNNRTTIQHIYTQQDGTVSTTISSPGEWMVSVAQMKASTQNVLDATCFNLIFGYR